MSKKKKKNKKIDEMSFAELTARIDNHVKEIFLDADQNVGPRQLTILFLLVRSVKQLSIEITTILENIIETQEATSQIIKDLRKTIK